MTDLEQTLADYFSAYGQDRIDRVVEYFAVPCHIVSDQREVALMPLASRAACRDAVEKVLAWHRTLGAVNQNIVKQFIIDLSPRLQCVDVEVEVQDGAATVLYDFESVYTFVHQPDGWRIAAISHNQIPRLLQCLRARSLPIATPP